MVVTTRLAATPTTIDQVLQTILASSNASNPFPISFCGHLLFHRTTATATAPQPTSRHILAFSATPFETIAKCTGFAYVDTREEQHTTTNFYFNRTNHRCASASSEFIRSAVIELMKFAATLEDAPTKNGLVLFNFLDQQYVPVVKEVCNIATEFGAHNALVFTGTTLSEAGELVVDKAALDALNVQAIPVGTRFTVNNEAFVMDRLRLSDVNVICRNNKYAEHDPVEVWEYPNRPYVELVLGDKIIGPMSRVARVLPSLDSPVPEDLGSLPPVSWCFVHVGFSIGLHWTMPEFRRKGLAVYCTASSTKAYRDYMLSESTHEVLEKLGIPSVDFQNPQDVRTIVPHCHTELENAGSMAMFRKLGYQAVNGVAMDFVIGSLKKGF